MLDTDKIQTELDRAKTEYEKLKNSVRNVTKDNERNEIKLKAAEHDLQKAKESLSIQQSEYDHVKKECEDTARALDEYTNKENDYRIRVDGLQKRLEKLSQELAQKK